MEKASKEEKAAIEGKSRDTAVANLPIGKRGSGSLNAQIDRHKKAEAKEKAIKRKSDAQTKKEQKKEAKELFEKHGKALAESTANKNDVDPKEALKTLNGLVKWQPSLALKMLREFGGRQRNIYCNL